MEAMKLEEGGGLNGTAIKKRAFFAASLTRREYSYSVEESEGYLKHSHAGRGNTNIMEFNGIEYSVIHDNWHGNI